MYIFLNPVNLTWFKLVWENYSHKVWENKHFWRGPVQGTWRYLSCVCFFGQCLSCWIHLCVVSNCQLSDIKLISSVSSVKQRCDISTTKIFQHSSNWFAKSTAIHASLSEAASQVSKEHSGQSQTKGLSNSQLPVVKMEWPSTNSKQTLKLGKFSNTKNLKKHIKFSGNITATS